MTTNAERFARAAIACALMACGLTLAGNAHATAQRTFVSASGSDAAACSLGAPCRSFAAAIAQTNAGGEVIVLDSAGYGPVTVTKSVSLIAPPGIYAGITVFSGDGVTIATPGLKVHLRGLAINGQGGSNGINLTAGSDLHVERCSVTGMVSQGLFTYGGGAVVVDDSTFRENGGYGIYNNGTFMSIARTTIDRNQDGGLAVIASGATPAIASVVDTVVTMNFMWGIAINGSPTAGTLTADRLTVQGNSNVGVVVSQSGQVTLARSVVEGNGSDGVSIDSGSVATLVDTVVRRNLGYGLSAINSGTRALFDHSQIVENAGGGVSFTFSATGQTMHNNTIANNSGFAVTGTLTTIPVQ